MMIKSFYQKNYLSKYDKKNVVYLAYIGKTKHMDTFKYGKSSDVFNREYIAHRKSFGTFEMVNIFQTNYNDYVETLFEKELKIRNIHQELVINNKKQTELFITTDIYPLNFLEELLKDIIRDFELHDAKQMELEIEKVQLEKLKIQMKIKEYELEYAKYINMK